MKYTLMKLRAVIFGVCLLVTVNFAYAKIVIVANTMPGLLEVEGKNKPYNKVLNELMLSTHLAADIVYAPPARAAKLFDDRKANCIFPASKKFINEVPKPISSNPINFAKAYFFTLKPYANVEIINNPSLSIGIRRGFTYGEALKGIAKHKLVEVNTDAQNLGLIKKGRIDAFVAYIPDLNQQLIRDNKLYFNESVYVHDESFVCHNSPKNSRFLKELDLIITKLRKQGKLAALLGVHYVAP